MNVGFDEPRSKQATVEVELLAADRRNFRRDLDDLAVDHAHVLSHLGGGAH